MAVRLEKIILEVEDRASRPMATFAQATRGASDSLHDLDGSSTDADRSTSRLGESGLPKVSASARDADRSINQLTGRLALVRDVAVTLGPALVPIGALAVPAVAGLASALGFTAVAAGTVVAGFQGVGTAMESLNKAQLEPTAANLAAAREAMQQLSPAARDIVRELDSLGPAMETLRDASAAGLAPGIAESVDNLSVLLPKLRGLFEETSRAAGDLAADATGSLNSERWAPFLAFLEREAPAAVTTLGGSLGNLTHGLAELWMAMDPLNDDLLRVISRAAEGFDDWASNLGESQGLRDFIQYLRTSAPQVGEAFQAVGNALLQIAEAAAPLGGPALGAITAIADAVATIADSPMGTPFLTAVAAVTTLNRLLAATAALSAAAGVGGAAAGAGTAAATAAAARKASIARVATPVAAAGAASMVLFPQFVEKIDNIGNVDGLYESVDSLSAKLSEGTIPLEFAAIREASAFLSERSGAEQWKDGIERSLGSTYGKVKESDTALADLDASLSSIAQAKGPEAASKAFSTLTEKVGLSLQEVGQLKNQLPGFSDAVGTRSMGDLLNVFSDLPGVLNRSTRAANSFKGAIQSAVAALEGRASARDFEASIDDATAALKRNGRNLDINTAKGRENAAALDNIAGSALAVADGMRGANRVEFLKGARGDFIAMARDMGKTAAQARRLADNLGLVANQKVNPKVDLNKAPFDAVSRAIMAGLKNIDKQNPRPNADLNDGPFQGRRAAVMAALGVTDRFTANPVVILVDNASGKAANITNQLNNIPRSISTTVTTYFRQIGKAFQQRADGGWMSGPGGPRDDAIPTMLSNGEFVVNAAAAARNAALLEQINSGGRQSAAAASASRSAPQSVSVSFDDARVMVQGPDGSRQIAQMRAIAKDEIQTQRKHDNRQAGIR